MAKKIEIRKIVPEDVKTIALLHQKTVPGLSAKLEKDYLTYFYRLIIGHPEIHTCLAVLMDNKIVGVITVTQDAKKTYQLLHSLLSPKIVWRVLIGIIRGKISLWEIINRFRFERFIEKRLVSPYISILTVFVKKEYKKQGIGRLLLKTVIDHHLKPESRLYVDTRADNPKAVKFYQSAGFAIKDIAFGNLILEYKTTKTNLTNL